MVASAALNFQQQKMKDSSLSLRFLRDEDEASFKKAIQEFEAAHPTYQFAFHWDENGSFPEYVQKTRNWHKGLDLQEGSVPASYLVGVVGGEVVGRLSLRQALNEFLEKVGGHIGYCVVPRFQGKGYATQMLLTSMKFCREVGLERVLVTCNIDNQASQRIIQKCGGEFEGITNLPELNKQKRRYWINVPSRNIKHVAGSKA